MSDDSKLEYIKEFDAHCHPNGEWEEPKCTDPECEYCAYRPDTARGWMKVVA